MRKELNLIIGAFLALIITGCASKNVGSSESSAKILNEYTKKDKPVGWFYNFGIGKNYTEALADANKSLSFNSPVSIDTRVTTYGGNSLSNGKEVPGDKVKFVDVKPYNIYSSKTKCEIKESYDIPEGIIIVRICPDLQFFSDNFVKKYTDEDLQNDIKLSKVATEVLRYIEKESNNRFSKVNVLALLAFKYEVTQMDKYIFNSNFDGFSSDDIIFWINTEYTRWFNSLGNYKDYQHLKESYGIMYPYLYYYDYEYTMNKHTPNQYWELCSGVKVSLKKKLSEPQLNGITHIPEINQIRFISSKGKL